MRGQINEKCSKADRGDIKNRADVPAKLFGDRFKYQKRRISGPHVEHINIPRRRPPKDKIDAKCKQTTAKEGTYGMKIVLFRFRKSSRGDKIESHENKKHMPQERVDRQRPVFVDDSRGLDKRHKTAQKIKGGHKIIHSTLYPSLFQKRRDHV